MAKKIEEKASTTQTGSSKQSFGIGNGVRDYTYLKSFQPDFDPYIVFDPTTGHWGFVDKPEDSITTLASLKLPTIYDFSVNAARAYVNMNDNIVLEASIQSNDVGNFNGGGSGNKAIAGVNMLADTSFHQLPVLQSEVKLNTPDDELGMSYNIFVDLLGNGDDADVVIVNVTNTLGGATDKYGKTGAAASVTYFDITDFKINPPGSAVSDMENIFYIVGLGSGPTSTFYTGGTAWFANPINLDIFLNGGTMPITGEVFTGGFPKAKLIMVDSPPDLTGILRHVSNDGGMPKGTAITPICLQIGGSATNTRSVTEVTELKIGGTSIVKG